MDGSVVSLMAGGRVVVLALNDCLTSVLCPDATASELLASVHEVEPRILLDMSAVRVLDCSGIGLLASLKRIARSRGGKLSLMGLRQRPRLLLELCGLLRVFQTFENEEGALESIAERDDGEFYLDRVPAFHWRAGRGSQCGSIPNLETQMPRGVRI